jgi:tetratricopeptide (TPR) repeat protein
VKQRVVLTLVLALSGFLLAADDNAIVQTYLNKARELHDRGASAEAERLLRESLDLAPDNSETLFLLGSLLCDVQATTFSGLPLMERALLKKTWSVTGPAAAREALAHVYVRTRRYRDAARLLEALAASRVSSPAMEISRAQAAAGLGNFRRADDLFSAAERIYPGASEILLKHIALLWSKGIRTRVYRLAERGMRDFPDDPRFLYYVLGRPAKPVVKNNLFTTYKEKGGGNPRVLMFLLDLDQTTFGQAVEFSFNHGAASDVFLLESAAAKLRPDKKKFSLLTAAWGTGNGEKTVDADADGFYEEKYVIESGEVMKALFDANQDGLIEREILLKHNQPDQVILRRSVEDETSFRYNGYPRLAQAVWRSRNVTKTYEIVPDSLLFAAVKNIPAPADMSLRVRPAASGDFPDEKSVILRAWALIEDPADTRLPRRKWDLYQGRKLVLHEDEDRNGTFERTVIYNNKGLPLRGQVDHDGDGYAEITERYDNGRLVRLEYDANRDGRPEYDERVAEDVKEWDLDGDGVIDVRERRLPNGKPYFEYSGILRGLR